MAPLNILHVFRAPVGGLFRHVLDLSREQSARGHRVGLIADSSTGGERAEEALKAIEPVLALGLTRIPMRRSIGPGDCIAVAHVMRRSRDVGADVLHGHGAKGGAYARLAFNNARAVRAYTPHGGSLLFGHATVAGKIYLGTERLLMLRGDLFLFESQYSTDIFRRQIGTPNGLVRVAHNGVSRAEFEPVVPAADATDLVFLGELRWIKGIDVLIEAIARLHRAGRPITATLVGSGPDRDALLAQMNGLGLSAAVRFKPAMPGRAALALGRILVVPSRAESLPYVVLEAAAAAVPLIATNVGGISEVYGPDSDALVPPQDAGALVASIMQALDGGAAGTAFTQRLRNRVSTYFSVDAMVDGVLDAYGAALGILRQKGRR
ncbi:MAG TPA: glycosyltransferase family 4 protein [Pseudolabrys sp.]|nr:glycosyltransferase family 4 protein [Pseudolabrys sp.]